VVTQDKIGIEIQSLERKIRIAFIIEKRVELEYCHIWFDFEHVRRRLVEALVGRIDQEG